MEERNAQVIVGDKGGGKRYFKLTLKDGDSVEFTFEDLNNIFDYNKCLKILTWMEEKLDVAQKT